MQKVEGVENVRVSLNGGLTILDLKPGNTVTMAKLRQIIRNNGFPTKEATIVASGQPGAGGQRTFTVGGTNEQLALTESPQQAGTDWRMRVAAPQK
ncbi:MAG TPA: hypothetical protein VKH42_15290 [Vicinamibacterales bacterium]|nr:hypothetical protein [Vicinamibacterales bacterium]